MKQAISVALIALLTTGVIAGDHDEPKMTAEEQAMMEAMMANAMPGEPHKRLAESTGSFKAKMYSWGQSDVEPSASDMTVEREMQLGGRVLEERWSGDFMGSPFMGYSRTGYDNQSGRYWTTWTDNMSTGLFVAYGEWDDESGKLVYRGDAVDPITGEAIPTRSEVNYEGDRSETMVMYQTVGGQEFKAMAFELVPR